MTLNILTTILVIVTAIYAYETLRIMKANELIVASMRDQSEAAMRPYIVINAFHEPSNPVFYLRIANSGKTGASNVRLTLDKDFYQYGRSDGVNLKTTTAFQQPIAQIAPSSELIFGLAQGFVVLNPDNAALCPPVFQITASYEYGSRHVSEITTIDLRPYRDGMSPPSSLIAELKKLNEGISKLIGAVEGVGNSSDSND